MKEFIKNLSDKELKNILKEYESWLAGENVKEGSALDIICKKFLSSFTPLTNYDLLRLIESHVYHECAIRWARTIK